MRLKYDLIGRWPVSSRKRMWMQIALDITTISSVSGVMNASQFVWEGQLLDDVARVDLRVRRGQHSPFDSEQKLFRLRTIFDVLRTVQRTQSAPGQFVWPASEIRFGPQVGRNGVLTVQVGASKAEKLCDVKKRCCFLYCYQRHSGVSKEAWHLGQS